MREAAHFLGLGESGNAFGTGAPDRDVLKHAAVFAIGEVQEGRRTSLGQIHAGGRVIDGNQLVRTRIGQRLEEDPFDDAENGGIRADANGERDDRQRGEHGQLQQPSEDLPETHSVTDDKERLKF